MYICFIRFRCLPVLPSTTYSLCETKVTHAPLILDSTMPPEKSEGIIQNGGRSSTSSRNGYHRHNPLPPVRLTNGTSKESQVSKSRAWLTRRNLEPPFHIVFLTYLGYAILTLFGYLREFLRKIGWEESRAAVEVDRQGYVPLYSNFESFARRNMFNRVRDCWSQPICSVPGAYFDVKDRISHDSNWHFEMLGTHFRALNMGSYNYLGFAENTGPCTENVERSLLRYGVCLGSSRNELGTLDIHRRLEQLIAWYSGTEDAVVIGMGFATNSTCIPSFVGKDCLVLSDHFNHSSLILGCRLSEATVRVFKHNDMVDLERRLVEAFRYGCRGKIDRPPNARIVPWKKILIMVEGIYSMEGTIVNLPEVIRLKKKYRAYLYLDEAHSIGSVGPNGRGVVDYFGCDPADIDILMGTFTKSFGAAGGFVAGSRELTSHLRRTSHSFTYATSMAAAVAEQIISATRVITGSLLPGEGRLRIARLARNVRYFRRKLLQMGYNVFGSDDSPVVPILIYLPAKVVAFVRAMQDRNVAIVGVGFPATSLLDSRVRLCISAAHSKEMLDHVLESVDIIGDRLGIKYFKNKTHLITGGVSLEKEIVY